MVYIKKILSVVLIIAGVMIAVYPIAGQLYARYQEDKMLEEWLNAETTDSADMADTDPETVYTELQNVFETETAVDSTQKPVSKDDSENTVNDGGNTGGQEDNTGANAGQPAAGGNGAGSPPVIDMSKQKVLGIIQIPEINLKDPIVEGTANSNLRAGIGHIPGTPLPGEPGNCALAGHRNYAWKELFRRLDELNEGDEVIITTKEETLKYTVTGKSVVEPDDVSVLKSDEDVSVITMITCTPMYVHTHRLIVTAELVERTPRKS